MPRPAKPATRARLAWASVAVVGASLLLLAGASPAFAGAWWRLSSRAAPTSLVPGQKATIILTATNVGDAGVNATAKRVTITDTLPPGLEATAIAGHPAFVEMEAGHLMSCELKALSCTSQAETLPPFQALDVTIEVNVKPGASSGEENKASVQGGEQEGQVGLETPGTSLPGPGMPITVGPHATEFGVEEGGYSLTAEEEGGALDAQAGSHPFQLTTTLNLNQASEVVPERGLVARAPAVPKELSFNLPPGLIGDPRAVPPCPTVDFLANASGFTNACKPESAIGVAVVTLDEPIRFHDITRAVPLWNLEPAQGEPARFGFEVITVPIVLETSVRGGGDYGVSVSVNDASEAAQLLGSEVTIWGQPGDSSHDSSRGWACVLAGAYVNHEVPCEAPSRRPTTPFLTLPTSCTGSLASTVEGHSWPVKSLASEPGQIFSLAGKATEYTLPGMEGCERLPFSPSIRLEPEAHSASTPTGLSVDVHVPQQTTQLAESDAKATTVTLPVGVQLSPSSAGGLQACSEEQIGFEGPPGKDPLSEGAPQPLKFSTATAHCPDASKMGVVRVHTPLLEHELQGAVYLATPAPLGEAGENPFNSLLALYIVAEDHVSGVRVKLAGEVKLNGETGQISSTFLNTPQVPFEDFELEFFGGPRGSVSTPPLCGAYSTGASFTPWSGTAAVEAFTDANKEFQITSGAGGSPCANPQPFAPSFQAGSTNLQAGAFTPFTLQISRPDSNQALKALSAHLPAGVAAMLASLTPCPEPQASLGQCGHESEIGHATASSGFGPDPFTVSGGRVYLTGPYNGAPFGLSIVTPAVAGPFNLGNVVVRSSINVDRNTAAVTIASALPAMVQGVGMPSSGIPLQLQRVDVTVDRPNFQFNPTSCAPMKIQATLTGAQGASATASSPFQVANCASLPFHPTFEASTEGKATKANGASLKVKVTSSTGQANIAKTDLTLPVALPSRLSTLQKACLAAVFEANPAACDEGSVIGTATVHTPVLKSALSGPAYLVSHGNEAFPDVEFVLQGEGITLVLDGKTDIRRGITYSRFETVPDAPVSTFETVLPQGPHSALAADVPAGANYSLCGTNLVMPTTITGQNGAVITENTRVAVTGCNGVNAFKATRAQRLAKALKACRKKYRHSRTKRLVCEKKARRGFAAHKATKGLRQQRSTHRAR